MSSGKLYLIATYWSQPFLEALFRNRRNKLLVGKSKPGNRLAFGTGDIWDVGEWIHPSLFSKWRTLSADTNKQLRHLGKRSNCRRSMAQWRHRGSALVIDTAQLRRWQCRAPAVCPPTFRWESSVLTQIKLLPALIDESPSARRRFLLAELVGTFIAAVKLKIWFRFFAGSNYSSKIPKS